MRSEWCAWAHYSRPAVTGRHACAFVAEPKRGFANAGENENTTDSKSGTSDAREGDGVSDDTQDQLGDGAVEGIAGAGGGGAGKVYDATGENAELPEAGSVAAVGQYATIVQMLAGKGGLKATDANWAATVRAKGAFPDEEAEGIGSVAIAWQGSHDAGYTLDIEALVAADPDVLLVDNVDVILTDEDRARLQEAKIDLLTVPALGSTDTPDADIVAAVAVVGQILSSAQTYYDTSAQVTTYNSMHDEAIRNCLNANSGYSYKTVGSASYAGIYQGTSQYGMDTTFFSSTRYTTAFVNSVTTSLNAWPVAARQYSDGVLGYLNGQTVDATDGIGLSVPGLSNEFVLLDYYMQVSGVTNNSYDGAKPTLSGSGEGAPTIILPGFLASFTSEMQDKTFWVNSSSDSAGSTYGVVMNSVENAQNIGRIAGCLYSEYVDQADLVCYYYENFYHIINGQLATAIDNAMDGVRNWNNRSTGSAADYASLTLWNESDAATYNEATVEAQLATGIAYLQANAGTVDSFLVPTSNLSVDDFSMSRLYNQWTGEHFYTSNPSEIETLTGLGWDNERVEWVAPAWSTVPVYRLYNQWTGEHHYTTKADERQANIAAGWTDEGVGWYSDAAEGVPVYRLYNEYAAAFTHHYTTNDEERQLNISQGWTDEGTGWFGLASQRAI